MLMEHVEGKTVEEIKHFGANDMLGLFGPKLTPNRQKCCLLSWRVVQGTLHSPIPTNAPPEAQPPGGGS
jgi:nitrogen fixation NifU-like protein